jgi:hypothetical protein
MASVTSNPTTADPLANGLPGALTLRIEPPRTRFELHLQELRSYRELLFFLVWRDCQIPHAVHYSVLDAGLTRLLFQFHGSRTLPLALRSDPMAGVIDGTRWAPTGTGNPLASSLFASVGIVILLAFGGLLFFNHLEGSIADRV